MNLLQLLSGNKTEWAIRGGVCSMDGGNKIFMQIVLQKIPLQKASWKITAYTAKTSLNIPPKRSL
jgi:hypothetical protein